MHKLIFLIPLCILLCSGCASQHKPLYCNSALYTESMYDYLKDESNIDEQLEKMNEYFETCSENALEPAPGSYAHMGILYSKQANNEKAEQYFNLEKQKFPESAVYINFLMNKKKEADKK